MPAIQFAGGAATAVNSDVSCTGTTVGTAAAVLAGVTKIKVTASNTGVKLPTAPHGPILLKVSTTGAAAKVYPPTGGKINNAAADAGVSTAATNGSVSMCIVHPNGIDFTMVRGA